MQINVRAKLSQNEMYVPQVVCFCDIPVGDLAIHVEKYSPFGLSFAKDYIVRAGGCPVFYIPRHSGVRAARDWPPQILDMWHKATDPAETQAVFDAMRKAVYFDWMVQQYDKAFHSEALTEQLPEMPAAVSDFISEFIRFLDFHVFSQVKFFDHDLPDDHPENFYFEREWRLLGNLRFRLEDVRRVLLPRGYAERFHMDCSEYCGPLTSVD